MAKRRHHPTSMRDWFSEYGQYVLLIVVATVTIFLVLLAVNRPASTPSSGSGRTPPARSTSAPPIATPQPSATPITVAFLGDSYTAGDGASTIDGRWTSKVSAANGWAEINAGVAGTGYGTAGTSPEATPYAARVAAIVEASPDIVIVSGGRFDYSGSSTVSQISDGVAETFAALRSGLPDAQLISIAPFWDASQVPERLSAIADEIRAAVERVDGKFVDIGQPLDDRPELLTDDGILPNDTGYAVLFEAINEALKPVVDASPIR